MVEMEPAKAVNVMELAPAGTTTEAGAESAALEEPITTVLPPAGARPFRIRLQMLAAPEPRLAGQQAREETCTGEAGAVRVRVVLWDTPFTVAVTTAVWLDVMVCAVAVNVAARPPEKTIELGTFRLGLLLAIEMIVQPLGTAVRVTVQVDVAAVARVLGLHVTDDTVITAVRVTVVDCEEPLNVAVTVAD